MLLLTVNRGQFGGEEEVGAVHHIIGCQPFGEGPWEDEVAGSKFEAGPGSFSSSFFAFVTYSRLTFF